MPEALRQTSRRPEDHADGRLERQPPGQRLRRESRVAGDQPEEMPSADQYERTEDKAEEDGVIDRLDIRALVPPEKDETRRIAPSPRRSMIRDLSTSANLSSSGHLDRHVQTSSFLANYRSPISSTDNITSGLVDYVN